VTALVADDALSGLAGGATAAGDVRVTEQRYLAELALAAQQAPDGAQTLLVAPPREVDVVPAGVSAMISDATSQLWLAPAGLTDLAGGPSVDAGGLADPPDDAALDGPAMADVARAVSVRDDLAAAVADDPAAALAPYDAGTARAVSVAWRGQPDAFAAAAAGLRATLEQLRGRVTLLAPADGDYSLASSDAPLVLTVDNDLPFAVRVRLDVQSRTQWLTTEDIGPQVLAPDARTTLQVPTEARRSGGSTVTATLTTPSGRALGATVVLQVKSTVYGRISLVTTVAAGALLGLLFLRRAVRFVIARVRGRGPDEDEDALGGAPEGAVPATPPTRSPV
jgi:hypothetical protein